MTDRPPRSSAWRLPAALAAVCVAIMVLTIVGRFGASTWWPWEPLRVCAVLVFSAVVLRGSRRAALLCVLAWAFIASPLVVGQQDRGFASHFPNKVPGELLGGGVPSGPYVLNAGPLPVGLTHLTAPQRHYINGEGSYADATLVTWSVTLVPWPHVDRTSIIGLGGSTLEYWSNPTTVEVHRDDHDLLVSGKRVYAGNPSAAVDDQLPEARALIWRPTRSLITILGWILIGGALAVRLALRPYGAERRRRAPLPVIAGVAAVAVGTAIAVAAAVLASGHAPIAEAVRRAAPPRAAPMELPSQVPQQATSAALHDAERRIARRVRELRGAAPAAIDASCRTQTGMKVQCSVDLRQSATALTSFTTSGSYDAGADTVRGILRGIPSAAELRAKPALRPGLSLREERRRLDAAAKSNARRLTITVKACGVQALDYTQCVRRSELGTPGVLYGTGAEQVSVTAATVNSFTVTAVSGSGNTFLVIRAEDGTVTHTCTTPGDGGCPRDGAW